MTSNRTNADDRDDAFFNDLTEAHNLEVPALSFRLPTHEPASGGFFSRHWRPTLVAAAVAGLALALGASATLPGSEPSTVSAEEILQKATVASNRAADAMQPYHLVAETVVKNDKDPGSSKATAKFITETWYGGPEQYRTEQRSAEGEVQDGQSRSGEDVWLFTRGRASLKVVHGTASVLNFSASKEVLPETDSLEELLQVYNQSCMKATVESETTVIGRPAYVINVDFAADRCPKEMPVIARDGGRKDAHRITIDKELFLPLVTERRDGAGNVSYRYQVVKLDMAPNLSPSVFSYQPPAGVQVVEVSSAMEAKMAMSDEMPPEKEPETLMKDGCKVFLAPSSKEPEGLAKALECPANNP